MSQKPSDISVIVYRLLFCIQPVGSYIVCCMSWLLWYSFVIFSLLLFLISALVRCCGMVFVVLLYYFIMWYVLCVCVRLIRFCKRVGDPGFSEILQHYTHPRNHWPSVFPISCHIFSIWFFDWFSSLNISEIFLSLLNLLSWTLGFISHCFL